MYALFYTLQHTVLLFLELYDETCLVENPYFYVSDMECWPCENVNTVIDLTGFDNHSLYQSGIPYVVQVSNQDIFKPQPNPTSSFRPIKTQ